MKTISNSNNSITLPNPITQVTNVPYTLYLSLQGRYFVGSTDNLGFGHGTSAWAGLVNPRNSGVNIFVYVWTVTNLGGSPLTAELWLNSTPSGCPTESVLITPTNTALSPPPKPRARLFSASKVTEGPEGGIRAYERIISSSSTAVDEEDGKFVLGPGQSFIISLSNPSTPHSSTSASFAFGWAEEKITS